MGGSEQRRHGSADGDPGPQPQPDYHGRGHDDPRLVGLPRGRDNRPVPLDQHPLRAARDREGAARRQGDRARVGLARVPEAREGPAPPRTPPNHDLLGLAAITQPGFTADGQEFTCYSLVMQSASGQIEQIHDRMPVLVPAGFAGEWLHSDAPAPELIAAARNAPQPLSARVIGAAQGDAQPGLF